MENKNDTTLAELMMEHGGNARLIAAAPELLRLLKIVAIRLNIEAKDKAIFPCAAILPEIAAAIATAEGE